MTRTLRCKALIFATLVLSPFTACVAQSVFSTDSSSDRVTVSGRVINSENKEPIRGALVELAGFATLTDDKGRFTIQNVPRMTTYARAQKPGYFNKDQISGYPRQPQLTNIAPGMQPVTFELIPEGIVSGQVTSQEGDPAENVPVTLVEFGIQDGRREAKQQFSTRTDDQGRFRIADLIPGVYFLSAGPSSNAEITPASTPGGPSTEMGYSSIYYPSSPDLSGATPIEITPGKHMEVQLSVALVPFYTISGTVSGVSPGQSLSLFFQGTSGNFGGGFAWNARTGVFHSNPLPPGAYTIRAIARDVRPPGSLTDPLPDPLAARVEVNLNSSTSSVHLSLGPAKTIPINFVIDTTSEQNNQKFAQLVPLIIPLNPQPRRAINRGIPRVGGPGSQKFVLSDPEPGRYQLEFLPNGSFYAVSATSGNVDLLRDDLVIGPEGSADAIEVHVRDDGGSIQAVVSTTGDKSQIGVFAVSEQYPRNVEQFLTSQDGVAYFSNLAPGGYKVFALDNIDNLEYRKPGALDMFLFRASQVTVEPKQQATVSVGVLHREN